MAKTVTLQGATYNDVPAIVVPSQTLLASYKAITYSSASSGGYAYSLVGEVTTDWLYPNGIIVNYDGTEYLLPYAGITSNYYGYGAPMNGSNLDFSNYPIRVESDEEVGATGKNWYVYCQTNGSHSLSVTSNENAQFTEVSETTAVASDVASGKYFYTADGTKTVGTNSGGGSASNFVTGTFVADSGTGTAHSITIPYSGSGYPIMAVVVVEQGMYNSAISEWYSTIQRYAIGKWAMTKAVFTSTPTYSTSGSQNYGVVVSLYKTNTSSATSYSAARSATANIYSSSNSTASSTTCVRFRNATTMSYFTASTSYGLMAGIEYRYFIVYSS